MTPTPPGMPWTGSVGLGVGERPVGGSGDSVCVTIISPHGGVAGTSAVDAAIEADLTTNDALGDQFKAAFNLQAPAMPEALKV